jgi:hypothetical protein
VKMALREISDNVNFWEQHTDEYSVSVSKRSYYEGKLCFICFVRNN